MFVAFQPSPSISREDIRNISFYTNKSEKQSQYNAGEQFFFCDKRIIIEIMLWIAGESFVLASARTSARRCLADIVSLADNVADMMCLADTVSL